MVAIVQDIVKYFIYKNTELLLNAKRWAHFKNGQD